MQFSHVDRNAGRECATGTQATKDGVSVLWNLWNLWQTYMVEKRGVCKEEIAHEDQDPFLKHLAHRAPSPRAKQEIPKRWKISGGARCFSGLNVCCFTLAISQIASLSNHMSEFQMEHRKQFIKLYIDCRIEKEVTMPSMLLYKTKYFGRNNWYMLEDLYCIAPMSRWD